MSQQLTNCIQFFNNAIEPIYWFNNRGSIVYANPAACKELGFSYEELLELSLIDIDRQLSETNWPDFFQNILAGNLKHYQSKLGRKDGSECPVYFSFSSLTDEELPVCAFVHTVANDPDAGGHHQSLQYALGNAIDAFFLITTSDNRIQYVNQSACKLLGYSYEELISMSTTDIDINLKALDSGIMLNDRLLTEKHGTFETVHLSKDGSKIAVEISYNNMSLDGVEYSFSYARDITERKEAMRRQQELRFIIDRASDAVYIYDQDSRIRYVNDRACSELGYSRKELMDLTIRDIAPNLTDERWNKHWQWCQEGQDLVFESFHQRKDGSVYPVEISIIKTLFEDNEHLCAFVRDITSRKDAHREAEQLQFAVENAVDAFFLTSTDGRILHVNQSACKLLGYGYDELISMVMDDIDINLKKTDKGINLGGQLLSATKGIFESTHQRKDGSSFPVEVTYNNMFFAGIEYSFAFSRDISDRKEAERRQQELHFIIDHAGDAVYIYNRDGKIRYVNERACYELGYSRDELMNLNFEEYAPLFNLERWNEHWQQILTGQKLLFESIRQTKDGSIYPVEVSVILTVYEGKKHLCAIVRDISARKEAYREAEELRFAVENSFDPIYITNREGSIHYVNERACKDLGYSREELLTMTVFDLNPDYSMEKRDLVWEHLQKRESSYIFETRHRKKDGSYIPVEISINTTIIDGDEYACAIVRDITLRKEAYRVAEELRFAVENSFDSVYIFNKDGGIHYVNDMACRELGYSHDELMSMTISDINKDYSIENLDRDWEQHFNQDSSWIFETRHRKKDGSFIPVEVSINYTTIDGKEHSCAFVRNITDRKQAVQQLEILQFAIDNAIDPFYFYDDQARITYANKSACQTLGYSLEEILKLTVHDIDPSVTSEVWKTLYPNVKAGLVGTIQSTNMKKDGTVFPVEVTPTNMAFGGVEFGCSVNRDISDRVEAEMAIRESEEKFRIISETSPVALIIHRVSDGVILYSNKTADDLFGKKSNETLGSPIYTLFDNEDSLDEFMNVLTTNEHVYGHEFMLGKHEDNLQWVSLSANTITMQGEKAICSAMLDITEAHKLSMQLSYQAAYDVLTGLVNRREFESRLQRVINTAKQNQSENALCYMDLDQFKVINDTCGHIAGDELLRQLGEFLQSYIRKRDTLARLGGDEFAVLLENCSLQQAERVANLIRESIQEFRFTWENNTFNIGVSIGLVAIDPTDESINDVMRRVDAACYQAKENGRNRIHIYLPGDDELIHRHGEMQWVARINWALEQNRLQLWSQKIISVQDPETEEGCYELLLRMIDENGNSIPPGAFLPAAERYNLISQIDRWVISNALMWFTLHPESYDNLKLCSINLSAQSLNDQGILREIIATFKKLKLAPEKFCFEVTETAAISNMNSAINFIESLKELGCSFTLDDFGSGLSSFAYLKNLPVDFIKIDGMFIEDIMEDPIHLALVKSINDVGHVMGKKTVAEFVENIEILEVLRELGVDYAQGYGIMKPALLIGDVDEEQIHQLQEAILK